MKFMKFAAASLLAFSAASALAQTSEPTVGATIYGPEGNVVGTVESIAGGIVTVDTGKHKAPLPADVFGTGEKGPTITATQAQINAMLDEQIAAATAQRDAALVPGAMVHSVSDVMVGTVETVEGDNVVLKLETGPVAMKREHFAVNPAGTLITLFTMDQIQAAAGQAEPAAAS